MKLNQGMTWMLGLAAAITAGVAGYGVYHLGLQQGLAMGSPAAPPTKPDTSPQPAVEAGPQSIAQGEEATRRHITVGIKAGDIDPATGRKILYYHDPMVPGNKFDKPAKSPFMDMMLVPVYADGDAGNDGSKVTVSPRIQQNLGVRIAEVTEGVLSPQVSAVGSIAFNERDQAFVQARATGFIQRVYVRATLDRVSKGQALAELYVPDWIAAQEEFLSVRRLQGADLANFATLVDAARQRMLLVGMSEQQVRLVESTGKTQTRITLTAPISGVVVELMAREGMTVMPGATLFRINSLGTVWANADVPESQAALVRPGTKVQASSAAAPGAVLRGKVQAILPEVNPATRTLKARVELANPGNLLVPGMFVSMQFMDMRANKSLLIPTEAVIQTGKRMVVLLAEDKGKFRPVEVETGIESNGQTEIKRGLLAGQRVVVSSQFLIDSEASLKGVEARLNEAPKPSAANTAPRHEGEAKIEAIGKDSITLSHAPIPSIKWGAMTMDFKLPASGKPRNLEQGDKANFEFFVDAEGLPQITRIYPITAEPKAASQPAGSKP